MPRSLISKPWHLWSHEVNLLDTQSCSPWPKMAMDCACGGGLSLHMLYTSFPKDTGTTCGNPRHGTCEQLDMGQKRNRCI
eukprot:11902663-Alexandrium_andersonii.AAC.1